MSKRGLTVSVASAALLETTPLNLVPLNFCAFLKMNAFSSRRSVKQSGVRSGAGSESGWIRSIQRPALARPHDRFKLYSNSEVFGSLGRFWPY